MDGIGIPLLGAAASIGLFMLALVVPPLRRFAFAALAAPFPASIVLLIGSFTLADMNPAREYGAAYIPTGAEHDPSRLDYIMLWLAVMATFALTFTVAYFLQSYVNKAIAMKSQPTDLAQ